MNKKRLNWFIAAWVLLLSPLIMAAGQKPLTNEDIIKMVKAKLPEDTIVLAIQKSSNKFDTSPDALIALKEAGVTQKVLDAMLRLQSSPTSVESVEPPMTSTGLKLGIYTTLARETHISGWGYVSSYQETLRIKIESIDGGGNVKAQLSRFGDKNRLSGKVDASGKLRLEGFYRDNYGRGWKLTLTATVKDKTLAKGKYLITTQEGTNYEVQGVFDIASSEDDN